MVNGNVYSNDSIIKVDKKAVFYGSWCEKGISSFEHIFDYRNKCFYNFHQMQFLYGLHDCEFLKYHQLIKVIPKTIKETLSTEGICREPIDLLLNVKKTKYVTKLLNSLQIKGNCKNKRSSESKWENDVAETNTVNWKDIYTLPLNTVYDAS